jgi:hypothetical protein
VGKSMQKSQIKVRGEDEKGSEWILEILAGGCRVDSVRSV